jgi:uncharacterized membrane protein
MIGLGVLILVYGDFALGWPAELPGRQALVYAAAAFLLLGGAGLLFARTATISARILLPFLLLWTALRTPALFKAPLVEVNWQAVGEIAVLAAAGWALTGARGQRIVRMMFGLSLLAFGLSHFFYLRETVTLVPAWLPFRTGWAYLTGAGHFAAGLGVLLSIYPRLAAAMEAAMLTIFTVVVWVPAIVAPAVTRDTWWEFAISWAIAAGAWVVAGSIGGRHTHSLAG